MQGFGRVNKISLRVARNNLKSSDLQFTEQVIFTVASIQRLYWDLVRFRAEVESSREDLRLARQLYEGNRERVEIGKLAPIDLIESEAEVGQREQELTIALTAVREQEGTLKTALSKNGLASPFLLEVEVIPTDHVEVPATLEIKPLQELMRMALTSRPDIAQARLQLENADILLKGTRNRLLPSIDLVASMTNNGLAGDLNPNLILLPGQVPRSPDFFIGGLGRALGQVFRRNFPDYSVGLSVLIPLRNRRAQADAANALLRRRQSQLRMQQQVNEIRRKVQSAVVGLEQAHARYLAARATRELREKMLDGEEQKFKLGYSDTFKVVDLASRRREGLGWRSRSRTDPAGGYGRTVGAMGLYLAGLPALPRPADRICSLCGPRGSRARVLTRFVLKYTLRAAHLELGGVDLDLAVEDDVLPLDRADMTQQVGVEREVRRGGKP